jgi:hypothetical protein
MGLSGTALALQSCSRLRRKATRYGIMQALLCLRQNRTYKIAGTHLTAFCQRFIRCAKVALPSLPART